MKKRFFAMIMVLAMAISMTMVFTGCGNEEKEQPAEETKQMSLEGQELMVFSGAGLADPVQEIADTFEANTGCEPQIVFAATGQLISQIQTTESGDLLIAGAADELESMKEDEITESVEMVKHIPVVAVQKGNPLKVKSVADLGADGLTVLFPDPETTPIGKIAMKAFEDNNIKDTIDVVANTTTAPLAMTALAEKEADAAVIWKENGAKNDKIEVLDLPEMEKYIKVVPAVSLKYSKNEEARKAFLEFMTGEDGMAIWSKYGYEAVK